MKKNKLIFLTSLAPVAFSLPVIAASCSKEAQKPIENETEKEIKKEYSINIQRKSSNSVTLGLHFISEEFNLEGKKYSLKIVVREVTPEGTITEKATTTSEGVQVNDKKEFEFKFELPAKESNNNQWSYGILELTENGKKIDSRAIQLEGITEA